MVIKENQIYLLIFFFGYGVTGSGITNGHYLDIVYLFSPIIFFIFIFFFKKKNEIILNLNFIELIKFRELISIALIFLILLFLVYERITLSIADDEYAYAGLGLIHSNFIIPLLAKQNILENLEVRHIYRLISFLIILGIFLYFYVLNKILKENFIIKLIIVILTVITARYLIYKFGGNTFPHPPIISIVPLFSTSFFGLSDLSLKFVSFIIYFVFAIYYFLRIKNFNNNFDAFLITLSSFGIPGILFLGSSLEQALFSMICFSIVAIELIINQNIKYKKLFIIILFFSLFRILSILSLILIAAHILLKSNSIKDFFTNAINATKESYPLLLLVPFISFSFTSNQNITIDRVGFDFLDTKFFLYDLPYSLINGFTIVPGILVITTFLILFFFIKKTFLLYFFLILSVLVYGNVVLHDNKYIYEIFFPILLSSTLVYFHLIKNKWLKNIAILFLISCNISNFFILKNFNSACLDDKIPFKENLYYKTNFGCKIIYSKPFDLKKTYKFLNGYENFSFKNLYVPGVYYGLLPSVINGMKVSEFIEHRQININQNKLNQLNNTSWNSASFENINSDKNINFVLLAALPNSKKIRDELINTGWTEIYKNINPTFSTNSVVLFKK